MLGKMITRVNPENFSTVKVILSARCLLGLGVNT